MQGKAAHPTVSPRWLLIAIASALAAAVALGWLTLCLLFWQGSWQLLYHPAKTITHTPADAGMPCDTVGFAATPDGLPQLHAWWIPAAHDASPPARFTVLYLHGAAGNLSDTVSALLPLHRAGLNIFAIDYRGFGQSLFARPSEASLREDTESALDYLANTRHIPVANILLAGQSLGANLALEAAAAHPNLAGVILEDLQASPTDAIFNDRRARLVPARLLVRDRWDATAAASNLRIPSLWFERAVAPGTDRPARQDERQSYARVTARKQQVWLPGDSRNETAYAIALTGWLDDLSTAASN